MKRNIKSFLSKLIIGLSAISLLPLLYVVRFMHQNQDDYSYAALTHKEWISTHSILRVLHAAWKTMISFWYSWSGSYTDCFINCLHTGIFGDRYYWISPVIIIVCLGLGLYFLLRAILVDVFHTDKKHLWVLYSVFLSFCLNFMPSPGQAFSWWTSGIYYVGFFSLECMLFANVIKISFSDYIPSALSILGNCVAVFLLMGGNLLVILQTLVGLFFVIGILTFVDKKKVRMIVPIISVAVAGFCLNVFSPGVNARKIADGITTPSYIVAIIEALKGSLIVLIKNMNGPFIMINIGLLPVYYWIAVKNETLNYKHPIIVSLLLFVLYSCMFAPAYYSLGNYGYGRLQNLYFLTIVILSLVFNVYFFGWLSNNTKINHFLIKLNEFTKKYITVVATVLVISFSFSISLIDYHEDVVFFNVIKIVTDGSASEYHEYMVNLDKVCSASEGEDVVVEKLKAEPSLLTTAGYNLSEDPNAWFNTAVSSFYSLNSISVKPDD